MTRITAINPFRLLSLPAMTEYKDLKKKFSATKKKLKVGLSLEPGLADVFPEVKIGDALEELEHAIADPVRRTSFRILWSLNKGLLPTLSDFGTLTDSSEHDRFLYCWYKFEHSEEVDSLGQCLELWETLKFSPLLTDLTDLLCREERIPREQASAFVDQSVEDALDELSCQVIAVTRRNGQFDLLEVLLGKPLLAMDRGIWFEQVIKLGNDLTTELSVSDLTVGGCEAESRLQKLVGLLSPVSSRAELWKRTLRERQAANLMMKAMEEGEQIVTSEPCSRAVKFATAVMMSLAHNQGHPSTAKEKTKVEEAIEMAGFANEDTVRHDISRLSSKYPNFFQYFGKAWDVIRGFLGSIQDPPDSPRSAWASEVIVDPAKLGVTAVGAVSKRSSGGCFSCIGVFFGCIGNLIGWLFGCMLMLALLAGCHAIKKKFYENLPSVREKRVKIEKCNVLIEQLNHQDRILESEEVHLTRLADSIRKESDELEKALAISPHSYDKAALSQRTDAFSASVEDYQQKEQAYNEKVRKRNALFEEIKALEREIGRK